MSIKRCVKETGLHSKKETARSGEVSGIENGNGNRSGSGSGCEQGKKKEEQPPPVARKTAECDRQRERGVQSLQWRPTSLFDNCHCHSHSH